MKNPYKYWGWSEDDIKLDKSLKDFNRRLRSKDPKVRKKAQREANKIMKGAGICEWNKKTRKWQLTEYYRDGASEEQEDKPGGTD